jgi:hypothetical protein
MERRARAGIALAGRHLVAPGGLRGLANVVPHQPAAGSRPPPEQRALDGIAKRVAAFCRFRRPSAAAGSVAWAPGGRCLTRMRRRSSESESAGREERPSVRHLC